VSFILFSMYFRSLNEFSIISTGKRKSENGENLGTVLGPRSAQGLDRLVRPRAPAQCAHDARGCAVTTTAATVVARLPQPHRRLLCREVFTECSGAAAAWCRARWWLVGLIGAGGPWRWAELRRCSEVLQQRRHSGYPRWRR
jgi:hypothetical protein